MVHRLKYLETGGFERITLLVASEFTRRSIFDDMLGSLGFEFFLSGFLLDRPVLVIWIFWISFLSGIIDTVERRRV